MVQQMKFGKDEELPEDWNVAIIHSIHKKGPKTDQNSYTPK